MKPFLIAMAWAALASWPAHAQTLRVTLDSLVDEALEANPEIAAARRRLEAAERRPAQQRSLPVPVV
jgi:outer membrane protein TolC